jgi:nitrite reductase/ring-hydroxylating ferredoxin subunit
MPRIRVGKLTDFPDRCGVAVAVGSRRLAVFRVGNDVYAIDDICSHRGFPLHDGLVNGGSVRCRTHGSCFRLASGAVERGPARRPVTCYKAEIIDDHVEVEVPDDG